MLTKTDFLTYLEAPMHLWASTHDQLEIKTHSPYEQHLIQQGQQIEALARTYLENVLLPQFQDAQLFWQPHYDDGRFEIRADALLWDREVDAYDLYEIKSSTGVHPEHEYDLTFQVLLLESILTLRHAYILHIDKTYQHGQALDLDHFFRVEELSEKVEKRRLYVLEARQAALTVTQMPAPLPDFACNTPRSCPCPSLCHPDLPPNPIYDLPHIGKKAIELRQMGITAIQDIPAFFPLNAKQRKHLQAVQTGQLFVDLPAVKQSLASLQYPLHFLDYETFNPAVPLFPGYHPYEHIVFQYSLFVIQEPNAEPQHFECLLTDPQDPAPRIVPDLLDHLGPEGSVVVWNKSFEEQRNRDLANHCPQFAERLMGVNARLYDLMLIFKDGHFVHPDFHGSASLKAVLPVMCPDLNYADLEISNGEEAMLNWYWLQTGHVSSEERGEIEEAMKAYCRLDTFGMIEILEYLFERLRSSDGY